jgi:DNA-binding NarL/FixJ family response regulator
MTQTETLAPAKRRILLVEDHLVVRTALASLIDDESDLQVCGGCGTIADAIQLVEQMKPDAVVVDITLENESGLELIQLIHDLQPALPILVLSMHDESLYAERVLRAGAKGYVMKKEAMDQFMVALRRVMNGEIFVSEQITSRIVRKVVSPQNAPAKPALETLSDREFEVFRMIAQGVGPTNIAQKLGLSVKTIETHREHIKSKLALRTGAELTRFAVKWSIGHP